MRYHGPLAGAGTHRLVCGNIRTPERGKTMVAGPHRSCGRSCATEPEHQGCAPWLRLALSEPCLDPMLEEVLMPVFHTRLTPDLVERYTCAGHWGSTTFYEILHQRAAAHPDREAIIDHRQRVTYGELCVRV